MRYVLFCCADERALAALPQAEWQAVLCATRAYVDELRSRGRLIASEALESAYAATTIRTRGGKLSTTDGPFAETKEQILGFYVIDCDTQEEAIEFARELAGANPGGSLEIRPLTYFQPNDRLAGAGTMPMPNVTV
jgi:hypothetical protein